MTLSDLTHWEALFEKKVLESSTFNSTKDPAHDPAHFRRVAQTAKRLCSEESARLEVVLPAAWLHDLVNVPKNDPRRSQASRLSASAASDFLATHRYPVELLADIEHAIEAHSFSAKIEPRTIEAAIVQDADRLDGLGAIGIARCFSVGGMLGRTIYHPQDPLGHRRPLDDLEYTVDHFFVKLFKVAQTLRTRSGQAEGLRRAEHMRRFLEQLQAEITDPSSN
ncbi:MAG: HD domain-containing protein [Oligoflexia bacterium]